LPTPRGNVTLDNLHGLNAILDVAEQGGTWRGLPKRFGNWHTISTRMNRWSKSGVLDRVVAQLQHAQIIRVKIEAGAVDRTLVKVHPDGTGALKKPARKPWAGLAAEGPPKSHLVAADARTARTFALSPGQAHDAPEGRTRLHRFGNRPRPHPPVDGSGV
jgi:transposase